MKHVWLISKVECREDFPKVVLGTKIAAKQWVKNEDPTLVFAKEDSEGFFAARTPDRDWICRFTVQRLPFLEDGTE